jgi:hypothetical protein
VKELVLHCPARVITLLCEAIRLYAHAAYPPGGSECAQSARESLLLTIEKLTSSYDPVANTGMMSRRIRAHVKSAVEYYCEQHTDVPAGYRTLLLRMLDGEMINDAEWR